MSPLRESHRNFATVFLTKKTRMVEWLGYQKVKKFEDMFSGFDTIHMCGGQTDKFTAARAAAPIILPRDEFVTTGIK